MSKTLALADIRSRLIGVSVPVAWPNVFFTNPTDSSGEALPFILVEMMGGTSMPIELGGDVWEQTGKTWLHMMVPVHTGPDVSFAMTDDLTARLRLPPYNPLVYIELQDDPGDVGDENGNYWRTTLTAAWRIQTFVERS